MKFKSVTKLVESTEYFEYPNGLRYYQTVKNGNVSVFWFTRPNDKKHYFYYPHLLAYLYEFNHHDYDAEEFKYVYDTFPLPCPIEEFDEWENVWVNHTGNDHFVYNILHDYPIATKMRKDYISGFDNKYFDLIGLYNHMESIGWIHYAKIEEIPYFNRDDDRTEGITFKYTLPQELVEEYYNLFYPKHKEFWSCKIFDTVGNGIMWDKIPDPIGARAFMKQVKE